MPNSNDFVTYNDIKTLVGRGPMSSNDFVTKSKILNSWSTVKVTGSYNDNDFVAYKDISVTGTTPTPPVPDTPTYTVNLNINNQTSDIFVLFPEGSGVLSTSYCMYDKTGNYKISTGTFSYSIPLNQPYWSGFFGVMIYSNIQSAGQDYINDQNLSISVNNGGDAIKKIIGGDVMGFALYLTHSGNVFNVTIK